MIWRNYVVLGIIRYFLGVKTETHLQEFKHSRNFEPKAASELKDAGILEQCKNISKTECALRCLSKISCESIIFCISESDMETASCCLLLKVASGVTTKINKSCQYMVFASLPTQLPFQNPKVECSIPEVYRDEHCKVLPLNLTLDRWCQKMHPGTGPDKYVAAYLERSTSNKGNKWRCYKIKALTADRLIYNSTNNYINYNQDIPKLIIGHPQFDITEYYIGEAGQSCASVCGNENRRCDTDIQTLNSIWLFENSEFLCTRDPYWPSPNPSLTYPPAIQDGKCRFYAYRRLLSSCDLTIEGAKFLCRCIKIS